MTPLPENHSFNSDVKKLKELFPHKVSFESIAEKHGIPEARIAFLKKVYTDNNHDLIILRDKVIELNLSHTEAGVIFTYHGAVQFGIVL